MTESAAFLADRLEVEGGKVIEFFSTLPQSTWDLVVYTENATWTVRSVLAHFVTAERGFLKLFISILEGGAGVGEDFEIDRYNASQQEKMADVTGEDLLALFKITRNEMVSFVGKLNDDELKLTGRHPFLGPTSLADMIKMVYRHNQIHYRELRKLV